MHRTIRRLLSRLEVSLGRRMSASWDGQVNETIENPKAQHVDISPQEKQHFMATWNLLETTQRRHVSSESHILLAFTSFSIG